MSKSENVKNNSMNNWQEFAGNYPITVLLNS
jgi:hypothetical protein